MNDRCPTHHMTHKQYGQLNAVAYAVSDSHILDFSGKNQENTGRFLVLTCTILYLARLSVRIYISRQMRKSLQATLHNCTTQRDIIINRPWFIMFTTQNHHW